MPGFKLTAKQRELRDTLAGPQRNHLIFGGSRSGKTFLLCYAASTRALMASGSRHAIFRRHGVAVKQSVGKDTMPKALGLAYPEAAVKWHEQDGYFEFPNGSEIWLAGLDDKERVDKVLGKEFATIYFNEASEIPYQSFVVAKTRLAQKVETVDGRTLPQRLYVDLNPTTRQHWTYRLFIDGIDPDGEKPVDLTNYTTSVANPDDNRENLSPEYLKELEALPERQRRRFFLGEYQSDVENALWRREMFRRSQNPPDLARVVVAIDPAGSAEPGSDETGIIAAGVDSSGIAYVLEDASGRYKPEDWAKQAIALYELHNADRVVAEVNNGGDMVEATLRAHSPDLPFTAVRASRGKVTRAEPIAALYERRKVFHVGAMDDLESQMCAVTSNFDRKAQGWSPDRVDAAVWAMTELFGDMVQPVDDTDWTFPTSGSGWMGS